jgi:chromosome segregation ATPase
MESGKQPMDPSLALINDEILSTQVRLMELYVKQAQATAANEAAKAQERFQAELTALQTELKQKNLALESQKALFHQTDRNLKAGLRARLLGSQRLLEARETDLGTTDAQALRQRIAQLESTVQKTQLTTEIEAARARERWQAELAALKGELERTESPLSVIQTSLDEVEGTLGAEIQDLRSQLAAKVELLEHRTAELQNARTQIALLQQRIQQLELTGAQTEEAVSEATRIRKTLQAELVALRTVFEQKDLTLQQTHTAATELERRLNLQLRGLQSQLAEQQGLLETRSQEIGEFTTRINDLQEQIARLELANKQTVEQAQSAARTLQDGLRAHLQELEATVSEKAELLQNRTAELQSAQTEIARLREHIHQIELNGAQTKAAATEATRIWETLEAELVALRTAVKQKDSSLQQTHAATRELEERLNAQLHDLQSQLEEKQGLLETRDLKIGELTAKTSDLQEQIARLELANKQTVKEAKAAARVLEDSLQARVQELAASVSEKAQELQNRTQELEIAQSETAVLQLRVEQLEVTRAQTEEVKNEADRMREGLQNQLNEIHRALEQKDAWLAQREAEFKESSEHFNAQLNDLKNQLAEKRQLLDAKDGELDHAAEQVAGLEERITQLESLHAKVQAGAATEVDRVRREFQSERVALQTSLREKEQALQDRQAAMAELEANLNGQIQDLRNELIENQVLLERREHESQNVGSETALLRDRIAQLESASYEAEQSAAAELERVRTELQAKSATLEAQLNEREHQLAESQVLRRESEAQLQIQLHNLQMQLAERQPLLESRNVEIRSLQDQLNTASEQIAQLESANQQAAAAAASNAEIAQQRFEAELAARQEELGRMKRAVVDYQTQASDLQQAFNLQLQDLQSQLAEKEGLLETRSQEIGEFTTRINDLQEQIARLELANKQTVEQAQSAARTLQDGLRAHLQELEATVSEKAELLQNRTAELQSAQAETARLRERITQLELNGAQTEAARNEGERVRQAVQNELADVQRALEQTKASLTQREAEFQTSSERLNAELNNLKNQLAEKSDALETQKHELLSAKSEITTLGDRMHKLEHAKTTGERNASLEIERLRERHQTELAGLRADLAQRQLALEKEQTRARVLEEKLKDDLHQLGAQLTEKQRLLHRGDQELQEQRSEIAALREELARTEFARRQTEMLVATQAEQIRERVKAEVEALDAQLREKENALKSLADREQELSLRIDDLRQQLAQKESLIESRDIEVTHLRTQAGDLLAQIIHLERAHAETLEQQRVAASQLEQNLRAQVDELQNQLTGKLALLETRNREVQALESRVTELADRIDRSEIALEQARAIAVSEIEQIRQQSQAELTARQEEVERKVEGLQDREAALYAAEQSFKVEIDALRKEVAEKRFLLENRNEQLLRVKMEMDELQDRIGYLESVARQAELESRHKDERSEEQPRPELEKLRQKLSQKEQMLKQRQTAVNDSEPGLQAQINSLRSELAEKQALLENPRSGFLIGEPTLTESQKERLSRLEQLVETIKADNEQTLISPHNRKWRFSLSRKRRWKS